MKMDVRDQILKCSKYIEDNIKADLVDQKMRDRAVLMDTQRVRNNIERVMDVDLENALDLAGNGKFQLFNNTLMLFTLTAALLEMIGIAFVLPAAACDLRLPEGLKGLVSSIPNIGVIITAPLWGQAADSFGRKPVMLISCTAAGVLGVSAALMPGLVGFATCKLAASMFLSSPSSLAFAYACELMPRRNRDKSVLLLNGLLMVLSTLSPVFAWAILSSDWRYQLATLTLRPWRLLTAIYAAPLLLSSIWLMTAEESPKFLMTKRRDQDALDVIRRIYAVNTGMPADSFVVKSLSDTLESMSIVEQNNSGGGLAPEERLESALALLRRPHLKWMALTGFLMFGLFSLLNGLFILAPDTINKVMSGSADVTGTICTLINQPGTNVTSTTACVDTISPNTFYILMVTTFFYGLVVTGGSIIPFSKKTLLVSMYTIVGTACLIAGVATNRMVAGVAMSTLQLTALGIGPLTAYAVHLFPTSLRGSAVGAVLMFGRVGSATGATVAGYLLAKDCTPTFYGFSLLTYLPIKAIANIGLSNWLTSHQAALIMPGLSVLLGIIKMLSQICAVLCLLLPGDKQPTSSVETIEADSRR